MNWKQHLKRQLWRIGYDMSSFAPGFHPVATRRHIFQTHQIDTLLDVGASTGLYAQQTRRDIGYRGRIISFEPLRDAHAKLQRAAQADPHWEVRHCALGDVAGSQTIHVAGNSYSSSLLEMLPRHEQLAPGTAYVGDEVIEVQTLDALFPQLCAQSRHIYLKIDTQGFESQVLSGALQSLARIDTVQMELSLVPLYRGEVLFPQMCQRMADLGYMLLTIENGFSDPGTGQLLQVDGIFARQPSAH